MSCIAVSVSRRSASGSTCRKRRPPGPSATDTPSRGQQPVGGLVAADGQQVLVAEVGHRISSRVGAYAPAWRTVTPLVARARSMAGRTCARPAACSRSRASQAAEQAVVEQAGHQARHERVAGADGVDDRDGVRRFAALVTRRRAPGDAAGPEGDDGEPGAECRPPGHHLRGRLAGVEPLDVVLGALDDVGQGHELLDTGPHGIGAAHDRGAHVGVVRDAAGNAGAVHGGGDLGVARGERGADRADVHVGGALGQLHRRKVPVQVEDVGRGARLVDGRGGRGRRVRRVGAAREQLHAAGLDVLGAPDAVGVGADEGGEPRVVAQSGEPERDVGRRPADVLGGLAVRGVHDVDEQLADDHDRCGAGAHGTALGVRRIHGEVEGVVDISSCLR